MVLSYYFSLFFFGQLNKITAIHTDIYDLVPGELHKSEAHYGFERLSIYCHRGVPENTKHFSLTVQLQLIINGSSWESFAGRTSDDVRNLLHSWGPFWSKTSSVFDLNPFYDSCVGIKTKLDHAVFLDVIESDVWREAWFFAGFGLFFAALKFNPKAYYMIVFVLLVLSSFPAFMYFMYTFLPPMLAVCAFIAVHQMMINDIIPPIIYFFIFILGYLVAVGGLSFLICRYKPMQYYWLIKLVLLIAGLVTIFLSSALSKGMVLIIVGPIIVLLLRDHINFRKARRQVEKEITLFFERSVRSEIKRVLFSKTKKMLISFFFQTENSFILLFLYYGLSVMYGFTS